MNEKPKRVNGKFPCVLTPEQRDEIVRRSKAGERAVELAREFGCSTSNITKLKYATKRIRAAMKSEAAEREYLVGRLDLKPGDVLLVKMHRETTDDERERIYRTSERVAGPGVTVMLVPHWIDLSVRASSSGEALADPNKAAELWKGRGA